MPINLLQDRTPGNEYRAVVQVVTNGVSMPASAHNTPNLGGVSAIPAVVLVDYTGNAVSAANPITTSSAHATASVTPAVTAASYASGNVVGGQLAFGGLGVTTVTSVTLAMKSAQTSAFDLYLFNGPVVSTFTDHSNATLNAADVPKMLGTIPFTSAKSAFANSTVYTASNVGINITNTTVGVLVANGTPTFLSTSDVTVSVNTSA